MQLRQTALAAIWPKITCYLSLILVFVSCVGICEAQPRERRMDAWDEAENPVQSGMLFVNDEFIPGPYMFEVTAAQATVNGIVCFEFDRADSENLNQNQSNRQRGHHDQNLRGGRGDREQQGWRGKSGGGRRGGGGEGFGRGESGGQGQGRSTTQRSLGRMISTLTNDEIVVIREGKPARFLDGGDVYAFCVAITANPPTDEQVAEFIKLAGSSEESEHWKGWLASFNPPTELRDRMLAEVERSESLMAATESKMTAMTRLNQFAYPLTIVGMLLSVMAFGHLLKWATKLNSAKSQPESVEIIRFAEIALLLMLAMGAIDLVWTILAGQADVMREVNPLAVGLLKSPSQLVIFKVAATGVGFAILYVWRRRVQIQNATWWMCLVSVLLTFRWVVFDSMMN